VLPIPCDQAQESALGRKTRMAAAYHLRGLATCSVDHHGHLPGRRTVVTTSNGTDPAHTRSSVSAAADAPVVVYDPPPSPSA